MPERFSSVRRSRRWAAALVAVAGCLVVQQAGAASAAPAITLPPVHAGFDYQITSAYAPPPGVTVVSRDHGAERAEGLYNICYVNGFQVQPDAESEWPADLLLRDKDGNVVYDAVWNEALLDIRTADKRTRIADQVGLWIDECASKRFNAVEVDNYDSYSRSQGLLTTDQAVTFIALLAKRSHDRGLAIGQKNAAELVDQKTTAGLDFAVAEECGDTEECGVYATAYGDHVIDIEYTEAGLAAACAGYGSKMSIVLRDVEVSTPGDPGYVRKTC
ncbi:endo alpha-1,4 polygalactosaminidase [Nocardia sp. XZ_19_385]|uniref:endo alpha-1,4 polygalactosaminidase n=1 Tax=Nocardia sp. XZ_19_385 TaxID=2769488 RepID=UPI0028160243|nr:endo alpha-1,4 polygalactosaminidase [Nocardia sp. XZ_19_385]